MHETQFRREEARALHRGGRLDAARHAYEALLEASPGDPDIEGLLGVLAWQEGCHSEAECRLRRSLADGAEPRISLRNLNNLMVLLHESGRGTEAKALLGSATPQWPEGVAAEASERGTVLSLVEAMLGYDQPAKARLLLDRALPDRTGDWEVLNLEGRLQLGEGDPKGAAQTLARAVELAPDCWQPLLALSVAQERSGEAAAATRSVHRLAQGWPAYAPPPRPTHKATLMVLNRAPQMVDNLNGGLKSLHLGSNYASEISTRMQDEYRITSLFADLADANWSRKLPAPDLVLNNVVNSERLNVPGHLETLSALVEALSCPVINHPDQVFQTTRQKNALLLKGVPNLYVPRIERYRIDLASVEDIVADIGARFDYPVILRQTTAHMSSESQLGGRDKSAVRVPDEAALREHLRQCPWREFYAVEFVDLKRDDGFYRKLRAVVMDEDIVLGQVAIYRQWMVSGWRDKPEGIAFYRAHPDLIEECNRIVLDPEATLGREVMETLKVMRERIPLDMFGIDFEVDRNGRLVFFEASAAMIFHGNQSKAPEEVRLPGEVSVMIDDTFRNMVARRLENGNR